MQSDRYGQKTLGFIGRHQALKKLKFHFGSRDAVQLDQKVYSDTPSHPKVFSHLKLCRNFSKSHLFWCAKRIGTNLMHITSRRV